MAAVPLFRDTNMAAVTSRENTLYFFLGLCDYSDKFPKMFCSSCGGECPSTANFCHQCGQQLNLRQVSNKAAIKKYHRGYPYAVLIMCTSDCGSGCF